MSISSLFTVVYTDIFFWEKQMEAGKTKIQEALFIGKTF